MKLVIKIDLDGAAFNEDARCGYEEVQRILEDLCSRLPEPLKDTNGSLNLHDANGEHVGNAQVFANDDAADCQMLADLYIFRGREWLERKIATMRR